MFGNWGNLVENDKMQFFTLLSWEWGKSLYSIMYVFPDVLAFSIYKIKLLEFQKKILCHSLSFFLTYIPWWWFLHSIHCEHFDSQSGIFKLFIVIIDRYFLHAKWWKIISNIAKIWGKCRKFCNSYYYLTWLMPSKRDFRWPRPLKAMINWNLQKSNSFWKYNF